MVCVTRHIRTDSTWVSLLGTMASPAGGREFTVDLGKIEPGAVNPKLIGGNDAPYGTDRHLVQSHLLKNYDANGNCKSRVIVGFLKAVPFMVTYLLAVLTVLGIGLSGIFAPKSSEMLHNSISLDPLGGIIVRGGITIVDTARSTGRRSLRASNDAMVEPAIVVKDDRGREKLIIDRTGGLVLKDMNDKVRMKADSRGIEVRDVAEVPSVTIRGRKIQVLDQRAVPRIGVAPPSQESWCTDTELRNILVNPAAWNADVNRDGVVGVPDLLELLAAWGIAQPGTAADVNADGVVDHCDELIVGAQIASADTEDDDASETIEESGFCAAPALLEALASVGSASTVAASDLDGDLQVGTSDLLTLLGHFGPAPAGSAAAVADLNGDGHVDMCDETILRGNFGAPPPGGYCGASGVLAALSSFGTSGVDADFDSSGSVGVSDLLSLLGKWGPAPSGTAEDLNNDGFVDRCDEIIFRGEWGSASSTAEWCSTSDLTHLLANADAYLAGSDVDVDGHVGVTDLLAVLASMGMADATSGAASAADVDGDGTITRCDELMVRHHLGNYILGQAFGHNMTSTHISLPAVPILTVKDRRGIARVSVTDDGMAISNDRGDEVFKADADDMQVTRLGVKDSSGTVRLRASPEGLTLRDFASRTSLAIADGQMNVYGIENRRKGSDGITPSQSVRDSRADEADAGFCAAGDMVVLAAQIRQRNISADVTGDGIIDGADLEAVLLHWGNTSTTAGTDQYDITRDGKVDKCDEIAIRGLFGMPTVLPATEVWCSTMEALRGLNDASKADVNNDGRNDEGDLIALRNAWVSGGSISRADVNEDGRVDHCDEAIVRRHVPDIRGSDGWCDKDALLRTLSSYESEHIDADLNDDGVVNAHDLMQLLSSWGPARPRTPSALADLNGDEVVDNCDMLLLRGQFGRTSTPPPQGEWCSSQKLREVLRKAQTKTSIQQCDLDPNGNSNGKIDDADRVLLLDYYGKRNLAADFNQDGKVDQCDILQFKVNWGLRAGQAPQAWPKSPSRSDFSNSNKGAGPNRG